MVFRDSGQDRDGKDAERRQLASKLKVPFPHLSCETEEKKLKNLSQNGRLLVSNPGPGMQNKRFQLSYDHSVQANLESSSHQGKEHM